MEGPTIEARKTQLKDFYRIMDPSREKNVDPIFTRFTYEEIYEAVMNKYGSVPDKWPTPRPSAPPVPSRMGNKSTPNGKANRPPLPSLSCKPNLDEITGDVADFPPPSALDDPELPPPVAPPRVRKSPKSRRSSSRATSTSSSKPPPPAPPLSSKPSATPRDSKRRSSRRSSSSRRKSSPRAAPVTHAASAPDADPDGPPPGASDPKFAKYVKMLKAGLPRGAVENALVRDQLDPADFFGAGGGSPAPSPVAPHVIIKKPPPPAINTKPPAPSPKPVAKPPAPSPKPAAKPPAPSPKPAVKPPAPSPKSATTSTLSGGPVGFFATGDDSGAAAASRAPAISMPKPKHEPSGRPPPPKGLAPSKRPERSAPTSRPVPEVSDGAIGQSSGGFDPQSNFASLKNKFAQKSAVHQEPAPALQRQQSSGGMKTPAASVLERQKLLAGIFGGGGGGGGGSASQPIKPKVDVPKAKKWPTPTDNSVNMPSQHQPIHQMATGGARPPQPMMATSAAAPSPAPQQQARFEPRPPPRSGGKSAVSDFVEMWSDEYNHPYWFNPKTGDSVWEKPPGWQPQSAAAAAVAAAPPAAPSPRGAAKGGAPPPAPASREVLVMAAYDFAPRDPNHPLEMAIKYGDIMEVLERGADGWWKGKRKSDGRVGLFPEAYVVPWTG